jgi:hypothetical protein
MAEAIAGFREAMDRFARIETLGELLEAYSARPLCHGSNFNRLLGAFWLDALREGDTTRVANLNRAIKVLSNVYAAMREIATSGRLVPEDWARKIVANNILGDTKFHEFIDSRAHFLADQKNPNAEAFAKLAVSIRTRSRVAPSFVQIKDRGSGVPREGSFKVHIPVSPDRAELWFLISKDFGKLAKSLADDVAFGSRTIQSCMVEAAQYAARDPSPRHLANSPPEMMKRQ